MTISKKTYAFLTLPWRCLDDFPLLERPAPPNYETATNAKVWWLIALCPVMYSLSALAILVGLAYVVVVLLLFPLWFAVEWIARSVRDRDERVDWKEDR